MRAALAATAAALLVLAGCSTETEPSAVPELVESTLVQPPVEPTETPVELGKPFTISGPNYAADVTINSVVVPGACDSVPNKSIAIDADVNVKSGDGTREVLNTGTIRERTPDGYIKKDRVVSRACDGLDELDALNVQTGDKYKGIIWLQDDIDPASEILINTPSAGGPIAEVFVLDLAGLDPQPESAAEAAPPAAAAPVVASEPTVVECLGGTPGPARWSDGTTRYSDWCYQTRGGPANDAAEGNSGLYGPNHQELLRQQAEAQGQGRTSGEVQMENGCRAGYIDADVCAGAGY